MACPPQGESMVSTRRTLRHARVRRSRVFPAGWPRCPAWVRHFQAAAPADLSLGVKASDPSDLQLTPGGEVNADVLAHYSTALQFEASGKLRQALEHYLAVFKADPTNAELADHTASIALQFQGRRCRAENPRGCRAGQSELARAAAESGAGFASTYPPEDLFEKDDTPCPGRDRGACSVSPRMPRCMRRGAASSHAKRAGQGRRGHGAGCDDRTVVIRSSGWPPDAPPGVSGRSVRRSFRWSTASASRPSLKML
jgi:hypothetical protein